MFNADTQFLERSPIMLLPRGFYGNMSTSACLLALFAVCAPPAFATPQAMALKDLPEDSRASITKELARQKTQQSAQGTESEEGTGNGRTGGKDGCRMDVGSQNQPSPAARRVVTVVTGPVVQICK